MEFVQETERIIQNINKFSCPSDVHMTQESCHFGNPALISSYQLELDNIKFLIVWQVIQFLKLNLKMNVNLCFNLVIRVQSLNQISSLVVLPELSNILEPVLIPIISELESIISPIHISFIDKKQDLISLYPYELTQNFENHLDILASYPFSKIELMQECDLKILMTLFHCALVHDSILTPEYGKKSGKDTRVIIESKSDMKLSIYGSR